MSEVAGVKFGQTDHLYFFAKWSLGYEVLLAVLHVSDYDFWCIICLHLFNFLYQPMSFEFFWLSSERPKSEFDCLGQYLNNIWISTPITKKTNPILAINILNVLHVLQYLEMRFNRATRILGAACYLLQMVSLQWVSTQNPKVDDFIWLCLLM